MYKILDNIRIWLASWIAFLFTIIIMFDPRNTYDNSEAPRLKNKFNK